MKNNNKQWQRVWAVYLFIFTFTLVYIFYLNASITWKGESILMELLLLLLTHGPLMLLVICKLIAECILISYAGWKTRQTGSSLSACFKVGVICSLVASLAGLTLQLGIDYLSIEKRWIDLVSYLVVVEKLLLFWFFGLISVLGGKLYDGSNQPN